MTIMRSTLPRPRSRRVTEALHEDQRGARELPVPGFQVSRCCGHGLQLGQCGTVDQRGCAGEGTQFAADEGREAAGVYYDAIPNAIREVLPRWVGWGVAGDVLSAMVASVSIFHGSECVLAVSADYSASPGTRSSF